MRAAQQVGHGCGGPREARDLGQPGEDGALRGHAPVRQASRRRATGLVEGGRGRAGRRHERERSGGSRRRCRDGHATRRGDARDRVAGTRGREESLKGAGEPRGSRRRRQPRRRRRRKKKRLGIEPEARRLGDEPWVENVRPSASSAVPPRVVRPGRRAVGVWRRGRQRPPLQGRGSVFRFERADGRLALGGDAARAAVRGRTPRGVRWERLPGGRGGRETR